ncbi:hypothetical protein MCC01970_14520 [Bifidobacteriaceae bacterium MCC01970]|nr:hypothetical protein MCC01970_14520 [Bifidobacteriaceae bacterium MCC01970]
MTYSLHDCAKNRGCDVSRDEMQRWGSVHVMDGSNVWDDESTQQLKIPDLTNQIGDS